MTKQSIQELLKNSLGNVNYEKLKADHLAILDEGIEQILNGEIKIDDIFPTSYEEILICLSHHFVAAMESYQMLLKGLLDSDKTVKKVVVNYRGQKFIYHSGGRLL